MTDHTTAAQADNKEIRAGFELCYATDANDPANVSDLGHFTNGWRACIISQLRAPVADERALPPLPKPAIVWHSDFTNQTYVGYTADHMRDYGRAALASAPVSQDAAEVHSLTGETGYTDVDPATPVAGERDPTDLLKYLEGKLDGVQLAPGLIKEIQASIGEACAPVAGEAQEDLAPPKCPITGRPFFMALEHPELGWVPTYGGPYDSYTIPHLDGKADQPWHERELCVYRYDHDLGGWRTDEVEVIPLRIVHEDVLNERHDAAPQASEAVRNDGFSDGVITALEVMTAHGDWGGTAYCELLQAAGLEAVVRRAIDQETWESAGLDRTPMAIECRAALAAQSEQS